MKRFLIFVIALEFACSACAIAQSWHWALAGGYNPTSVTTAEGLQAWTAVPVGGGAYWEQVASDTGTALRIVDTDPGNKVRWDDTYHNLFKDDVSSGMTVSFRIKLEASAGGDYTVFRFSNHLLGATTRNKLQVGLKNFAGIGNCLYNTDYANGLGGTPTQFSVEDHQWHTFRSLHTVNPDGTVRYRIYWDGALVQDYSRTTTNTDAGKLGTDGNANIFTYQLDYFAVSLDGAWLQEQLDNPCELFISAGPLVDVSADQTSATITWETNEPAVTSKLHYGSDPSCAEVIVEPGGAKTSHSVTIPIAPFKYYYYYVESINSTCPRAYTNLKNISTGVVQNPSFENATQDPWVKIPDYTFDGVSGFVFGIWPHFGSKMAYSAASGVKGINEHGEKHLGGMYQIISGLTPGEFYEVSAWIWTRTESDTGQDAPDPLNAACRVGVDPTAGTFVGGWNGTVWVENGNISWSPWTASDNTLSQGGPWKQISCAVKATGTTATIYIQQQHLWPLLWNLTAFDDVWVQQAPPPPAGIGATKAVRDGYPAFLPDKIVTASWPAEKRFYVEEEDRSSAIKVTVPEDSLVPAVGAKATVSGAMTTNQHGDRVVAAVEVIPNGTADVPGAICMNNKAVGEKTNSGLLVKVLGKVLENPLAPGTVEFAPGSNSDLPGFDPYGRYYMYIDDGSGVPSDYNLYYDDPTEQWLNLGLFKGVKVYYHPDYYMPQVGEYVICTGIAGYELCDSNFISDGGNFSLVRTLEMRQTLPVDESSIPKHLSDLMLYPAGSY